MDQRERLKNLILFGLILVLLVGCIKGAAAVIRGSSGDDQQPEVMDTSWKAEVAEDQREKQNGGGQEESETDAAQSGEHLTEEITEPDDTEAADDLADVQTQEELTESITEENTVLEDLAAPVFLTFTKDVTIKTGSSFDINEYVGYGDDVDRNPRLSVDGSVDTATAGSYPLHLTLTDAAGHATTANMQVRVVEPTASSPSAGAGETVREDFETFAQNYQTEHTVLGIDVSRWQEDIDFNQVKAAGCQFAMIRIGGYDDGSQYVDRYYQRNIQNAKAAGLKVGIYWHAEESSVEEVKANVAFLMRTLGGETLDFPIAYDWEDFNSFERYGMNLKDLNVCFETFCQEVENYGYEACIYSSKNFLENVWTNDGAHPVWLAHYISRTDYAGSYYMWQHCSNGRIAGIEGPVDFNVWYQQ